MNGSLPDVSPPPKNRIVFWFWVFLGVGLAGAIMTGGVLYFLQQKHAPPSLITQASGTGRPTFTVATVIDKLDHPWDVAFLPDGTGIFTERNGKISTIKNGAVVTLMAVTDVRSAGEGGLMGLAVDPQFAVNRYIYTCYNSTLDIRVVRWKVNDEITSLSNKQAIVTGMPSSPGGRHSGCRMSFGPDGYLWIGTGDAAQGSTPQDPKSLGGKILRINRDGEAAPGNLDSPFDPRIYSYGHRNTQGIAFLPSPRGGIIGYSAEHGSSIDDEVNILKKGNFGWAPDAGYTERGISMTDRQRFPDAIDAYWSSGFPTQAPSALAYVKGSKWQSWDGVIVMAMLKAQHLKVLTLDAQGKVTKEEKIIEDKGRLRDVEQAPDGSLYITTDNGDKDVILRVVPAK